MRITFLASLLLTVCYIQYAEAGFANIIKTVIQAAVKDLVKKNQTLVKDINLEIPSDWDIVGKGYLDLPSVTLWGLTNTNTSQDLVYARDIGDSSIFLSIRLDISRVGLEILYDMDIALLDVIPLYGNGGIQIALSNLMLNVSLNLDINKTNITDLLVTDLDLELTFHDSYSYINGFWKNPDVDAMITVIINLIEKLIAMFYAYERECFKCVLNPLLKYVVNTVLTKDTKLEIDCDCLKHLFDIGYNVEENVKSPSAKATVTGMMKDLLNTLLSEDAKRLFGEVDDILKRVVEKYRIIVK